MPSAESRASLLLLPGLLCDARLWRAQVEGLDDVARCEVPELTDDDSVAAMARRVLASAPPRFALAALSMGGYVAFEILRQAPQRVTRLMLLATSAGVDSPQRAALRRASLTLAERGRFAGVTRKLLPQLVAPPHVEGEVGEVVMDMAQRVGRDAFLRQQRAILTRPDSRPLLPTLALPTVVGVGDDDQMTPPVESSRLHEAIAGSRLHVFAACGHLPPLEKPHETTQLMRHWLQSQ